MPPTQGGRQAAADQLACISAYFSAGPLRCLQHQQHHGRLPLAWVATSPSARLLAEQHNAWVVLPFGSTALSGCPYAADDYEENSFGAALANATTPLLVLKDALGLGAVTAPTPRAAAAASGESAASLAVAVHRTAETKSGAAAPSKKILSWLNQATESFADVDHAASPVEPEKSSFFDTSRAKPPPQKATRRGTGVSGPKVEDPLKAARSCGVHLAGVTTVLVSGVHLYEDHLARSPHTLHRMSNGTASERRVNPSATLLFPSTTCCGGSVSSLLSVPPNAALFDAIPTRADPTRSAAANTDGKAAKSSIFREGAKLHDDDGGAVDETAHDPQTAASVYTVQQVNKLHQQVREGKTAEVYTTVWYRHVFVDDEAATHDVVCGVSRWWLQRPVRVQELPSTKFSSTAISAQPAEEAGRLRAPSLYVKFIANIGADLWWPHRFFSVVHHRVAEHPWHATLLLRWLSFLWMLCVVIVESVVHGVPEMPAAHHAAATHGVNLVESLQALGSVFGGSNQLAALDVSHTAVRGVHLLACAVGKVTAAAQHKNNNATRDCFAALDVAGCIQLHHRQGELTPLTTLLSGLQTLSAALAPVAWKDVSFSPLPVVDLLVALSLRDGRTAARRSATGMAMALLSHHGSLTWVSGPGCSLDNAALHELGMYALLVEAVTASRPFSTSDAAAASSCSICAMDLTSALSLNDLNPAGYLVHLEQLLVPFTYVTDEGVTLLDGHTYPLDLGELLALCDGEQAASFPLSVQALTKDIVVTLARLTAPSDAATVSAAGGEMNRTSSKTHHRIIEDLHQRFRSHLYQIDFTYCSLLSSVNGLVRQQRLELLNMSQTRINKAGLFKGLDKTHIGSSSSPAGVHNPPLRLFIAEMCEHLSDLSGLANLTTLECLVVRSGSLGDDGLRSLCTKQMRNLRLVDLSYCDRLHHIGCIANLPALETLILDSTDVLPAEVRQLRRSRSLETLSLRFCTEFAFIGKDQKEFEAALGNFPSLKNYVYEDLIGDEELRGKKSA